MGENQRDKGLGMYPTLTNILSTSNGTVPLVTKVREIRHYCSSEENYSRQLDVIEAEIVP